MLTYIVAGAVVGAPTAVDDDPYATNEGHATLAVAVPGVLGNDTDA